MMKKYLFVFILTIFITACGSSTEEETPQEIKKQPSTLLPENLAIPNNQLSLDYDVLLIGNSHTQPIEKLLTVIFENANVSQKVNIDTRLGSFLDTIVDQDNIVEVFQTKPWTHVVLQGQKYSQSQSVEYSTDETKIWIQRAKAVGATPILFPEHPQKSNPQEADYVHDIHLGIASEQYSCVAPVGLVWNKVGLVDPSLELHASDRNHATELGSLLTAMVLYQVISGQSADMLPYIANLPGSEATQALFGQMASQVIAENTPCNF